MINDKDLLDVVCFDNSMGNNKELFTIGRTYKGCVSIDNNGNVSYNIYEPKIVRDKTIYNFQKKVTGIYKEHIYFSAISYMRNKTIKDILK